MGRAAPAVDRGLTALGAGREPVPWGRARRAHRPNRGRIPGELQGAPRQAGAVRLGRSSGPLGREQGQEVHGDRASSAAERRRGALLRACLEEPVGAEAPWVRGVDGHQGP